jgi:hypothetical protein
MRLRKDRPASGFARSVRPEFVPCVADILESLPKPCAYAVGMFVFSMG